MACVRKRGIRPDVTVMAVFGFEERKWRGWGNEERVTVHVRMRRDAGRGTGALSMSQTSQATDYVLVGLPSCRRFPRRQEALEDEMTRNTSEYSMVEVEITSPITFDSTVASVQTDCRGAYRSQAMGKRTGRGVVSPGRSIPMTRMTPTCWRVAQ